MGLISEVLLLPLAPVRAARWAVDQVVDAAEREYYDPGQVHRELAELSRELDEGRITREEFERAEDELLELLAECEEYAGADEEEPP